MTGDEAATLESAKAALDQVLVTIGQHRLRQCQVGRWSVGAIDPPAQTALGSLDGGRIALHGDPNRVLRPGFRRTGAILAHLPLLYRFSIGQRQQTDHGMTFHQCFGGLLQGCHVRKGGFALFGRIQLGDSCLRLRQALAQGHRGCGGMLQRTHHQAPFRPGDGVAVHSRRELLRTFEAFGDFDGTLGQVVAIDWRQRRLFRPYRLQIRVNGLLRHVGQRQRRQVMVAARHQIGPRRQRHQFAIADVQQAPAIHAQAHLCLS